MPPGRGGSRSRSGGGGGSRRGGGGRGGTKSPPPEGDDDGAGANANPTAATAASSAPPSSGGGGGGGGGGGWGSPSRFGHFAKYTKPKIGSHYQCAVPEYVPPTKKAKGGANGDESGGGSSSAGGRIGTRGTTRGGGGRARGGGGKGGRAGGKGGGSSRGGGGEPPSKVEQSMASGEASAIDLANAAAEEFSHQCGSLAQIPLGGVCVHRPPGWRARTTADDDEAGKRADGCADGDPRKDTPSALSEARRQEEFLTYARNVFLQTPRVRAGRTIGEVWDEATLDKFKGGGEAATTGAAAAGAKSSGKGQRGAGGRGKKRRVDAEMDALFDNDNSSDDSATANDGALKSVEVDGADVNSSDGSKFACTSSDNVAKSRTQMGEGSARDASASGTLPLCGLEDDERSLSYLHAKYHGDLEKAKFSIMVNSDRGYGVQRRRQLKKKRKEANEGYPNATAFTSESWRWRVHQARPSMLGDYRSSRDPTYPYFDPAPASAKELEDGSVPWRIRRYEDEDEGDDDAAANGREPARPRGLSITWTDGEIDSARRIWKSVLAYTKGVLDEMESRSEEEEEEGGGESVLENVSKPPLGDLIELVEKAHALPTPEETFGRRDPSARQMSENMNAIIDAVEEGRDCVARVLKCLKDDGEGIDMDALQISINEIECSCPVGLDEVETVKRQIKEALLWEEKLENNVDHATADSDASDGEDIITEKKLTLEKVERLVSKGRNLTLRPSSLVRLQNRIESARVLRRKITVWNEARSQENPQNMKFIQSLIKQANKVDLAFPELFTLTGVHKKAEEWMDRASIAVRTTISYEELESLVSVGESLPLNVSDVLEKLQNRLKQAREWMARIEEIVPKSDDYLTWLRRFRSSLDDSEENAHLLSLLSEGSRIPVTMECSTLLQIEIDARHWTEKARRWIPQNFNDEGVTMAPQRRGKKDDVADHIDRASSIRDRLWFGEAEKAEWVLDGESELNQMIEMAEEWLEKYDHVIDHDSRRQGKLRLTMTELHKIIQEVNAIPLNLGTPATKLNRIFSQADDWMTAYYPLLQRCAIESDYIPTEANELTEEDRAKPLKLEELSEAVDDANSDLSIDLVVLVKLREHLEKAQTWVEQVNEVAPEKDAKKKAKQEKHSLNEISDLIDQSSSIIVDVTDELERLKLEQSAMISWRLQAQQTLKEITLAFKTFRAERSNLCSPNNSSSSETIPFSTVPAPAVSQNLSGTMTTRHIKSRRGAVGVKQPAPTGIETPAHVEHGGKNLFPLLSNFIKGVKTLNVLTPEGNMADELSDIVSWFTKMFNLISNPSELYEKSNFSKLDKLIVRGQQLVNLEGVIKEEIPEDKQLVINLRQSWAAAVQDDVERLIVMQKERTKFTEWCEKADEVISSTDKKVNVETLKELLQQSSVFPQSSEVVARVKKRAVDSISWVSSVADLIKKNKKIPIDEAKEMTDAADKLNITCYEYKTLRTALRATRGWLLRVKKCGAGNGQAQIAANLVTELINEHNTFLVTSADALKELKQAMCGYCVCRQPYDGFMIGCDGCEEWYHGPCVGISQEQAQKFDKYVCVRCSTLRVYKDNVATVAGILRKWMSSKGLSKARAGDSQRYGRKVRSAERDIVKAKADLAKYEAELHTLLGKPPPTTSLNGGAVGPTPVQGPSSVAAASATVTVPSQNIPNGNGSKSEKALRDKIGKAHTTIGNCEKRMEGYKAELVERKKLEAREDALAPSLKKWCDSVKDEIFAPPTLEKAELSMPNSDGSTSAPMEKAKEHAENLGIANFPDVDAVLNSFKIFSWCLQTLGILMRKPRIEEIRSLLAHSDSGYFKLPEAKCVRMLRSMSSRAQIWQSKAKKALMPIPNETKPYDLVMLRELLVASKQIPLAMPEETRLWSTIEDGGSRHCICGGPSDGSFMLGCDNCDRWFHGSCMKIDKATGDALTKWICPPCSRLPTNGLPPPPHAQQSNTLVNETSKSVQESGTSLLIQPPSAQPLNDISPHAPDPNSLWPPLGLRDDKEAVEGLGKVGDSDNEDFNGPIKPSKSDQDAFPYDVRVTSTETHFPLCQPVASGAKQESNTTVAPAAASKSIPQAPTYSAPAQSAPAHSSSLPGQAVNNCQPVASNSQYSNGISNPGSGTSYATSSAAAAHQPLSHRSDQTMMDVANMDQFVLSGGGSRASTSTVPAATMGAAATLLSVGTVQSTNSQSSVPAAQSQAGNAIAGVHMSVPFTGTQSAHGQSSFPSALPQAPSKAP